MKGMWICTCDQGPNSFLCGNCHEVDEALSSPQHCGCKMKKMDSSEVLQWNRELLPASGQLHCDNCGDRALNHDMRSSFIQSIESDQTGGGVMVDVIHLTNGGVLTVTDEVTAWHPNIECWAEGECEHDQVDTGTVLFHRCPIDLPEERNVEDVQNEEGCTVCGGGGMASCQGCRFPGSQVFDHGEEDTLCVPCTDAYRDMLLVA